ncbi:hypothetical protein [Sediminibacterium sp.]|jgi:hypothetical protein|uniref:hypothetical protein n=1 Tax=Sediminibacterium sp. TaxID=1917865 RepID=UPI0025FF3215|nr:hypothetical protein [Sediminibacterium sp.]MBW0176579.1 hypothetical protein [Sediminibacterium sp.]
MMKYLLILFFTGLQTIVYSQVKLSLEEKEILVNGSGISQQPSKETLDALVGTKSSLGYIVGSYNPATREENDIKRRSYRFKQSGLSIQYYAKESGIYQVFIEIRSSHKKTAKNNLVRYANSFQDGSIIIDSTVTVDRAIEMIGKDKLIKNGVMPFYNALSPYLLYAKNDLLIELFFDPKTKLIKLVSVER